VNPFRQRIGLGPPVVFAHRGDSSHAPENTLEAARLGYAAGAFGWELDVHLTRDGVAIVIHDDSLSRTTDVAVKFPNDARAETGFRVSDFDWDEVRSLDAGSWFFDPSGPPRSAEAFGTIDSIHASDRDHFASGEVRVPRLIEALELTRSLNWLVNVELKSFPEADERLVDVVLNDIDLSRTADYVLLSSFDHTEIEKVVRVRPQIPTGALIDTPLVQSSAYARNQLAVDYLHVSAASLGAESREYRQRPSAAKLRTIREDDLVVPRLVYTVNDARPDGLAAHLARLGVCGFFSDDPQPLVRLLTPA
jgi:glycerophosphoryl diester phosphodiesterase